MELLLWIVYVLVAVAVIALILLQHGKGADMGAAFGSGASGSVFGAAGSANFLSRTTSVLAAIFFAVSLALAWISAHQHRQAIQIAPNISKAVIPNIPVSAPPTGAPGAVNNSGNPGSNPASQDIPK
ncbi:MAG: preprotein translocase subunit SecG [Pseudomonadota bacterium]|nr:preprotein translocase subunit SecG [Pseudomonadota bacterium]